MFDSAGHETYIRQRISLERALQETGDFRGSAEIESQMKFVEDRLVERIKQEHEHATEEMDTLRIVLRESTKKWCHNI